MGFDGSECILEILAFHAAKILQLISQRLFICFHLSFIRLGTHHGSCDWWEVQAWQEDW